MKKIIKSLYYLLFPIAIGSIVGIITTGKIDYQNLIQPPLSPPKILFPIAWTIIYLLLGTSYLILKKKDLITSKESFIYYLQLFINYMWSIIFFLWKYKGFAIIWILLLDIIVIYMIYLFYKKNKLSAYLNSLYLIWILFATYLTISIYILN
jgi:tryptophan-rich sensory protein